MSGESWLGIVTGLDPLRVRRDYPTSIPPEAEPLTLVPGLQIGDKVYIEEMGRRWVIVGKVNPAGNLVWRVTHPAPATTGWRTIAAFPGNGRSSGTFHVFTDDGGDHDQLTLQVDVAYWSASLNVISYNTIGRSSSVLSGIRYLNSSSDATYGPGILQVRFSETPSGLWSVSCDQPSDPLLKAWTPGDLGTSTSGFNDATPAAQSGVYLTSPTSLSLATGWAVYGGAFAGPTIQMMPGGLVVLEGLISAGTGPTSLIGTLPEGARPRWNHLFNPHVRANSAYGEAARVDVTSAGAITLSHPAVASVSWVSLSGITFPAYQ